MAASPVFPFMPGGAADGTRLPSGAVMLTDLTGSLRFGLKGGGSAGWLASQGVPLPAVNRIGSWRGTRVLRLGNEDILLLAEGADNALAELASTWHGATRQRAIHRGVRRAGRGCASRARRRRERWSGYARLISEPTNSAPGTLRRRALATSRPLWSARRRVSMYCSTSPRRLTSPGRSRRRPGTARIC